jgi:lysozyme
MNMPTVPNCIGPVIDISGNNSPVDLATAKVKNGIMAVFIKATEGGDWKDTTFAANYQKAKAQSLPVGAYHFATARPAALQVDNFIETVTSVTGSFEGIVPALDVEKNELTPSNTTTLEIADEWVRLFIQKTGIQPVIYGGSFLDENGGATPHMKASPLWLAAYTSTPSTVKGWDSWTLWQYTDGAKGPYAGTIEGIGPKCDQNIFQGTQADFDKLWQK